MRNSLTRREVLVATGLSASALAAMPVWARSFLQVGASGQVNLRLLPVPEALPAKTYGTEAVGISRATHDAHLGLYRGYAVQTNRIRTAVANMRWSQLVGNQIYSEIRGYQVDYSFAYGGYLNHENYFETLTAPGTEPHGPIRDLIERAYGSVERWADDWKSTGIAGRGWVYLAYDLTEGQVFNFIGDAQNTFPMWNCKLLLAMDVYEHAYYLDFETRRGEHIDAYMQCIDWDEVNARLPRL